MTVRATLPDLNTLGTAALRSLILSQQEEILLQHEQLASQGEQLALREAEIASHKAELESQEAEIERLKLLIAKLRRMQFGRKSEKLERRIEQLELQLEGLEASEAKAEEQGAPAASHADGAAKAQPARGPLPEHLPRETHRHEPKEQNCPECGGRLRKLGEEVSEMLEYVPAEFKVVRHVGLKLSCARCERVVEGATPSRPIARGMAGPGLLANVLVSKYAYHLPLYRQSEIYARAGVELERSTLADWVGAASRLLEPLVESLRRYVMAAGKLHADDTPAPVLQPGLGKTKTGRLWTYVRDDRPAGDDTGPAVWFAYSPDRRGEHPQQHLQDFCGILQADAYAGFNAIYESGRIQEAPAGRIIQTVCLSRVTHEERGLTRFIFRFVVRYLLVVTTDA